jgi:hypothetical protein
MELSNDASPILLSADPIFDFSATKVTKMRQLALSVLFRLSVGPLVKTQALLNALS